MARIRVPRRGPGRAGTWPGRVAVDKGCSSIQIRTYLRRRRTKGGDPGAEPGSPWHRGRDLGRVFEVGLSDDLYRTAFRRA